MSFHKYGFACQIVGYYVMFMALQKLFEYKHSLGRAVLPLFFMALCSVYDAGAVFSEAFFATVFPSGLTTLVDILQIAGIFVFHIYLLRGIGELANDTELPKISKSSTFNLAVITFYLLLSMTFSLISIIAIAAGAQEGSFLYETATVLAPITALFSIIYPIPVLYLLYSCYMRICAPEDVDMESRKSKNKK